MKPLARCWAQVPSECALAWRHLWHGQISSILVYAVSSWSALVLGRNRVFAMDREVSITWIKRSHIFCNDTKSKKLELLCLRKKPSLYQKRRENVLKRTNCFWHLIVEPIDLKGQSASHEWFLLTAHWSLRCQYARQILIEVRVSDLEGAVRIPCFMMQNNKNFQRHKTMFCQFWLCVVPFDKAIFFSTEMRGKLLKM